MKKGLKAVLMVLGALILLTFGYFVGYKRAYDSIESREPAADPQTFYAEIRERETNRFLVQGLAVNDANYRGEFTFSVTEETALLWRGTALELSDLEVGDTIAVTFDGEVLMIYPAQIRDVIKIQLLDDEK